MLTIVRGLVALTMIPLLSAGASAAGQEAGRIVGYVADATVAGSEGSQTGKVGLVVYAGDRIKTESGGQLELLFADQTKMVVGPRSQLTIDAYVYAGQGSAQKLSIEAAKGAFRFITGGSPKQAYDIKTPTATIGIRGTSFDLTVTGEGQTSVALFTGAVRLCGFDDKCTNINDPCSVAVTGYDRATRALLPAGERRAEIRDKFPYVRDQSRLRQDFRAATSTCGDIAALGAPTTTGAIGAPPQSIVSTGDTGGGPTETASFGGGGSGGGGGGGGTSGGGSGGGGGGGNPGNGGPGNAGASPGGNDMGGPGPGASDAGHGNGGGGGHGNSGH